MAGITDPLLLQTERKIESALTPRNRRDYTRIVIAGMKTAIEGGPNSIAFKLKYSKDPLHDAVVGSLGVVLGMRQHSRGTMPLKAMIPAAMTLMLKALDFAEKAKLIPPITTQVLVQATHLFTDTLFKAFHITPQMMQAAAHSVGGIMRDPQKVDKMKVTAGMMPIRPPGGGMMPPGGGVANLRRGLINGGGM